MSGIVIIGGGASGLLVAVNLLRKSESCQITLVEPNEALGQGVAYSTNDSEHLLNVPAGRMSGLVEEPKSLCEWADVDENTFISRRDYGRYLKHLLDQELSRTNSGRFQHLKARALEIRRGASGYEVQLDSGTSVSAEKVVLALGNSDSIVPEFFKGLPVNSQIVRDVWLEGFTSDFSKVAIIGTGLTFYDIVLSILRENPDAVIHGISRNGLLPSPHLRHRAPALPVPEEARVSAQGIRDYLSSVGDKWREAQDGIRHDLQEIWAAFPETEKKIFFNQYFRWWNSLRHRSAPEIDEQIKGAIQTGSIVIHKAGVDSISFEKSKLALKLSNGSDLRVEQVINCCGNQFVATHPLITQLVDSRFLSRGPLGFGVACDAKTLALKDAQGKTHEGIYGIGPILVGELLETTAIPEIRVEAELVARELLRT
ncbi:MAG: hypothetical protein FGM63_04515 [Candidatus Nanopelagicaceae bacterium]|nr:hypothetical protein [Candidatus Nanopelagicaceae bacterium]